MATGKLPLEVADWLTEHGWFPGRDIGQQADELIALRVQDSERQYYPLAPVEAASKIIHSYGLLELGHPRLPARALVMDPTGRYEGDAAEISELAANLGQRLFPVGYEASELGLVLVDEGGRFFHLHHSGAYFIGSDENDAFSRFLSGADAPDAEDFFV
ncbi:SUKH-3 domain-containing protein [Streptomyces sp. NPDC001634]|uniref:SUKH-3 domain-containing protein n=1 Tax=Streptomyces sp. NPDC001634 TaxID=3154390 RepID=UPI00332B2058